jgi:hypothetical protein
MIPEDVLPRSIRPTVRDGSAQPQSAPDHIFGRQRGDTIVFEAVGAAGQGVARVVWWIYILPIDADGRGADEAQLACLLFGLDLDDLDIVGNSLLGHDRTQALECKVVRRTLFVIKEAHSHEVPPNSSLLRVFSYLHTTHGRSCRFGSEVEGNH